MNKSSKILLHLPDAICCYRSFASLTGVILGVHWLRPWLFSTALISDLWDGWYFRKYVIHHPNWRAWNPLPITLDPLADLTLICCGVIFGAKHYLALTTTGVIGLFLLTGAVSIVFVLMNFIARKTNSSFLKTLSPTLQTHISCFLMVYTTAISWKVVCNSWTGGIITVLIFYTIFAAIGDKTRLIRKIN